MHFSTHHLFICETPRDSSHGIQVYLFYTMIKYRQQCNAPYLNSFSLLLQRELSTHILANLLVVLFLLCKALLLLSHWQVKSPRVDLSSKCLNSSTLANKSLN